ncbi:hypothetical protein HYU11_00165 [Candidatus Woesearchaeota archaeon]|nr:hypothetical protein [Candidatus Woesearchaeota archaeon]
MPSDETFFQKLFSKPNEPSSEVREIPDYTSGVPDVHDEMPVGGIAPFGIIKYRGVFDLNKLYKVMVRWLKSRRFEFHEPLYRFKPPELILNWRAERKKTPFVKDIIVVNLDIRGYEEVETIVGGVKKRMVKGRLTLNLNFGNETGYADIFGQKRWNSVIERHLKSFLHRFVIKRDFELLHLDALMYETWKFHKVIKDYLRMECHGNLY